MMSDAICIEDVTFGYTPEAPVIENIRWRVSEGQFIAIVGPNGGGKTTLLKILLGFIEPQKGSVLVLGENPTKHQPGVAYVPQSMIFDKQFPISALEVVLMGRLSRLSWHGRYTALDRKLALEAMETVGVVEQAKMPFGKLSGGQRQRVLIARALVSNPKLLLLDEPTASVDPEAEQDIYKILTELQGKMTIVMVTHDLQTAMDNIESIVLVQRTLTPLTLEEVCQHFAIGLYHPPVAGGPLNVIS